MNRSRFNAPPVDNRMVPALFTSPPPNVWQGPPAPNDYPMQINPPPFQNPPSQQPYNQNPSKKSYCKTCNSWTAEPYECHITSPAHMQNKANARNVNQQYDPNAPPEQLMSINCTPRINNQQYDTNNEASFPIARKAPMRQNDQPYEPNNNYNNNSSFPMNRKVLPRANEQSYDPNISQFPAPRKVPIRTNIPLHEPVNPAGFPIAKKIVTRATIPPFKIAGAPISNEEIPDNNAIKRIKLRKNRPNTNQPNTVNFNQNNFQSSHSTEGPYFDLNDNTANKRIDETVKTKPPTEGQVSTPITANRGREMLLPVSGVYCTLCDEFFRNTDTAETKHCKSSAHLDAYEKILNELKQSATEKKPTVESKNEKQPIAKRPKCAPKTSNKPTKPSNKSPETSDTINSNNNNKAVEPIGLGQPVTVRDSLDIDQSSSSEFQGPDVSLEFPDEIEDYDE